MNISNNKLYYKQFQKETNGWDTHFFFCPIKIILSTFYENAKKT